MKTLVVRAVPGRGSAELKEQLHLPADILRRGGLVAFPTETVYGLGANALDSQAVRRIFQAKGRPSDNPLIVHVSSIAAVRSLAAAVSPLCERLMREFWPGPLTLIFPRSNSVPPEVAAGLETVAIRCPDHPVALALIELAGVPVAAPSANVSGKPSPTNAQHVLRDLFGRIEAVVDGGPTGYGVESTVLEVLPDGGGRVLRPGAVTVEELEEVLGTGKVSVAQDAPAGPAPSPGMKYRHYSPEAPLWLVAAPSRTIAGLAFEALRRGLLPGVLAETEAMADYGEALQAGAVVLDAGSRRDLETVARRLFGLLREFDEKRVDVVFSQVFPEEGLGLAVMNRLRKASGKEVIRPRGEDPRWMDEVLATVFGGRTT